MKEWWFLVMILCPSALSTQSAALKMSLLTPLLFSWLPVQLLSLQQSPDLSSIEATFGIINVKIYK